MYSLANSLQSISFEFFNLVHSMNIPSGTPLKTGLEVSSVDFFALLKEMEKRRTSGYLAIAIAGEYGVEEGTMFFDEGKPVAAFYEYYFFKKTFYGREAFERIVNASASLHGVIDIFELSTDQVHLVLAFNESAISVPTEGDISPRKVIFSKEFEERLKGALLPQTRGGLLKKYKLAGVMDEEKPVSPLKEVSFSEDFLQKLMAKDKKQPQA